MFATQLAKFLPAISSMWSTKSTKLMMIIFWLEKRNVFRED